MKGIPLITIEELEKNRFLFRFANGETIDMSIGTEMKNADLIEKMVWVNQNFSDFEQMIIAMSRLLKDNFYELLMNKFSIRQ
jgi:hypothetical protein